MAANNEKKIVFSKEIDNRISGTALVLALLVCGLVLQYLPIYFGNEKTTEIVKWIVLGVGVLGVFSEAKKFKSHLVGFDNILFGVVFIGGWLALYRFGNDETLNAVAFVLLLLGCFGFFQGVQQLIYSLNQNMEKREKTKQEKENYKADIIAFATKALGIILLVAQAIKAILDLIK